MSRLNYNTLKKGTWAVVPNTVSKRSSSTAQIMLYSAVRWETVEVGVLSESLCNLVKLYPCMRCKHSLE